MKELDSIDFKILTALQRDGRATNQMLADGIGMSASPCWRRVRQLEEEKYIQGYRAVLDRRKIGLGVMVFIRINIDCHGKAEAKKFEQKVMQLENVIACYSISGNADFLLQVVAKDLDSFAEFAMTVVRQLDVVKYFQTPRSVFLLPFLVHK